MREDARMIVSKRKAISRGSFSVSAAGVVLLAMLWALPASAGPTLFTANLDQVGGIVATANWYRTESGPGTLSPAVAQNTAGGGFEFPAQAFSRQTAGYTFTIAPVYPYIWVRKTMLNRAGTIEPNYFSPSVAYTFNVGNTEEPNKATTPRTGWMRFNPGTQGLGGVVPFPITRSYVFDIQTSLGILKAIAPLKANGYYQPAGFSMGKFVGCVRCATTYPASAAPSPTAFYSGGLIGYGAPWATGMVTVADGSGGGPVITTTTGTGIDSRSAFDTGAISLVTPRTQYVYQNDGSDMGQQSVINMRDDFAIMHRLSIEFLPEPTHVVMMFAGLVGLVGLRRFNR
jgi:hypothetical protein